MRTPIRKDDRHCTYADYLKFPDDERWDIIDGVAYGMSPSPSDDHQRLSAETLAQVHAQLRGKQLVHPVDRILTIYRLDAGARYGAADIRELSGKTEVAAVPGLEIDWDLWEPLFESN